MKKWLYKLYLIVFKVYSVFPINKNKTTFIMTHDISLNGNIMLVNNKIKEKQPNHILKFITKNQFTKGSVISKVIERIKFFLITPYYLATSNYIFLDNVFLPMAYLNFHKSVKIIQLWHGLNSIKKFGQLSNTGEIKELEYKANSKYTHVIVSSEKVIELHEKAFGVRKEVIFPLGLPRQDMFFDEDKIKKEKQMFYSRYEWLREKKIILYAPTFRDNKINDFDENMDLSEVIKELPDEYIIINKFHPFVSDKQKFETDRILDFSNYEDLTRLLLVSDILITDYSSIIFDYAILRKPIILYAYDKEEYEKKIRGFYYNYKEFEDIVVSEKRLISKFVMKLNGKENLSLNIDNWIKYRDSYSTDRIYNFIYKN